MANTPEQIAQAVGALKYATHGGSVQRYTPAPKIYRTGGGGQGGVFGTAPGANFAQQLANDWSANGARYNEETAAAAKAAQDALDWDKMLRPVTGVLNALTAAGSGIQNVIDKGSQRDLDAYRSGDHSGSLNAGLRSLVGGLGGLPGMLASGATGEGQGKDFIDGFLASWNGDAESPNYMYGSKLIEQATDRYGGYYDPKYQDVEDNVNPWVKGIGGFVADVALDPITYAPGGIIAAGVRGGARAAKLATGASKIPAAIQGVTKGTEAVASAADTAYKLGRWSGRVKPVGLQQWSAARDFDALERITRKANVPAEALFTSNTRELAAIAKTARLSRKELSERLAAIAPDVQHLIPKAKAIWEGTAAMKTAFAAGKAAKRTGRMGVLGASEYVHGARPGTRAAAEAAEAATVKAPTTLERDLVTTTAQAGARAASRADTLADDVDSVAAEEVQAVAREMGIPPEQAAQLLDDGAVDLGAPTTKAQRISDKARSATLSSSASARAATRKVQAAEAASASLREIEELTKRGIVTRDILMPDDPRLLDGTADDVLEQAGVLSEPYVVKQGTRQGASNFLKRTLTRGDTRRYDAEQLGVLKNVLKVDPKGRIVDQQSILDILRTKGPTSYDRLKQAAKANTRAINDTVVFDGEMISGAADAIVPGRVVSDFASKVDDEIVKAGGQPLLEALRGVAMRGIVKAINDRQVETGVVVRLGKDGQPMWRRVGEDAGGQIDAAYTRTSIQNSTYTALRSIRAELEKVAPGNMLHTWRLEKLAVSMLREMELKMGVITVTTFTKSLKGLFKPKAGAPFDMAFLHLDDLYRILDQDLLQDLRVTHRVKKGNVDYTFPPTVMQLAALASMKLEASGLRETQKIAELNKFVREQVRNMRAVNDVIDIDGNAATSALADRLVIELRQPEVLAALRAAHNQWGALSVRMGQDGAAQIAAPIKQQLDRVLYGLTTSEGDKIVAIRGAVAGLRRELKKAGLADELDGRIAMSDFNAYLASFLDPASAYVARNADRMQRTQAVHPDGRALTDLEVSERQAKFAAAADAADPLGAKSPKGPPAVKSTQANKKRVKDARIASSQERADLAGSLTKNASELVEAGIRQIENPNEATEAVLAATGQLAEDVALLQDYVTRGVKGDFMRGASGRYNMEDVKITEVKQRVNMQSFIGNFEKSIERLVKEIGITDANAWFVAFQKAGSNENVEKFIRGLAPELQPNALAYWKHVSSVFDHSIANRFARAGLDADWINHMVRLSPIGSQGRYHLSSGALGWEVGTQWTSWKGIGEEGGVDALTLLKSYSWALDNAALIPNIAADLSAQFGHARGFQMTKEEAIAAGWKRVETDRENGARLFARWIDPDQYFPPDIIRQLGHMETFLSYNLKLGTDGLSKVIKASDRVVTAVKSSVTLWRPGHHVVNIMGEALMNILAGVTNPARYGQAWAVLRAGGDFHKGTIFGHNYTKPLDDMAHEYGIFDDAGEVVGAGLKTRIGGVERELSYSTVYQLLDRAGILITHNTAEDLLVQGDELMKAGGRFAGAFGPLVKANKGLGEMSARRDNVFRIAHAVDLLQKKGYRTIDDAMDHIRREVYDYHPTMQTLSGFEQKWVRRVLYFYTWQRQALTKILESLIEHPGRATLAPKANFEASTIGGDPQTIGEPMPNDPRLASFAARNILGPHWFDEEGNIQGITINAPQLDVMQSIFGGIEFNPDRSLPDNIYTEGGQFLRENTVGMLSPALKVPIESAWQTRSDGSYVTPINDWSDYLIDQTGLGYISRTTGRNVFNNDGLFGMRSDVDPFTPEGQLEQQEREYRTALNAITGARYTEWSKYADVAENERRDEEQRMLDMLNRNILGNAMAPE